MAPKLKHIYKHASGSLEVKANGKYVGLFATRAKAVLALARQLKVGSRFTGQGIGRVGIPWLSPRVVRRGQLVL